MSPSRSNIPVTYLVDGQTIVSMRERIMKGDPDPRIAVASETLKQAANKYLDFPIPTVMDKIKYHLVAASGDPHDYFSISPYEWPCKAGIWPKDCVDYQKRPPDLSKCNNDTSLPWVTCDGERDTNRIEHADAEAKSKMINAVVILSNAAYFFTNDTFASEAAKYLRAWFLTAKTKMNPNLRYGQSAPGKRDGSHGALIDWTGIAELLDAVAVLKAMDTHHWTPADNDLFIQWWVKLLSYIVEFMDGERSMKNNHGSWYDSTVSAIALHTRNATEAKSIASEVLSLRIDHQIAPDGSFPEELKRTNSWSYSTYNIRALVNDAFFTAHSNIDTWSYKSKSGGSLRAALDFLLPFATGTKVWPYPQKDPLACSQLLTVYRLAANTYSEPSYEEAACRLHGVTEHQYESAYRTNLFYPAKYNCTKYV